MTLVDNIPSELLSRIIDIFNFYQNFSEVDLTPEFISFYENYPVIVDGLSLQETLKFRCLLKINIRSIVEKGSQSNGTGRP